MNGTLLENSSLRLCSSTVAVGTTTVNGTGIDTAGYDGVLFVVKYGAITDGTPNLKAQQSEDDGSSDAYADLAGSDVAVADTDDDKLAALDIRRPKERYVRPVVVRGGATGCVIESITAILYGAAEVPVTQHADVAASESHVAPDEGTA